MIVLILSIILGSLTFSFARKVFHEPKDVGALSAFIVFLWTSLLFSYLITPKETFYTELELETFVKNKEVVSNKETLEAIDIALERGNQFILMKNTKFQYRKNHFLYTPYPVKILNATTKYPKIKYK